MSSCLLPRPRTTVSLSEPALNHRFKCNFSAALINVHTTTTTLQTFPPKMGVVENDVRNDNYTVPPPPQRSLSISLESTLSPACISLTAKFSRNETGGTKSLRRLMTTTAGSSFGCLRDCWCISQAK